MHGKWWPGRAVAAALALAGCSGGDDGGGGGITEPEPAISVSLASTAMTLAQGADGAVAVSVARSGGYDDAVQLTLQGAPAGLTGTFAPASVAAGLAGSTLTLAAAPSLATGSHALTVRASGQGVAETSASLALTVVERPGFRISVDSATLTVAQGASAAAVVAIERTGGFAGAVALSAAGAPPGLTVTIEPANTAGSTAALAVAVGAGLAAGSYPLLVHGSAQISVGQLARDSVAVAVTVQGSSGLRWSQVSAGSGHTCGVTTTGVAYCWGEGGSGQRGDGSVTRNQHTPVRVSGAHTWVAVSAGGSHTCGVTTSREAYCWGLAYGGRLGNGDTTLAPVTTPARVSGAHAWAGISAGGTHTCGVTVEGEAYCWGTGLLLGAGSTGGLEATPAPVAGGHTWRSVAAATLHTCGVTTAGDGYCWGARSRGRLGEGVLTAGYAASPVAVTGSHRWAGISPSLREHSCGVTASGEGYCWGNRLQGVLGHPLPWDEDLVPTPTPIAGELVWAGISSGDMHTCGVTAAGAAYCWGEGAGGRLGHGHITTDNQLTPGLVAGEHVWASVDAGSIHTCGVTTAGEAFCWGTDHSGKLGAGPDASVAPAPIRVSQPQ